ncbi:MULTISPECIES: hypothetical protein [unclassified Paenibacillus]|uniref:hypothetical protein n=1 Tax=unclassified Paenibacillus TaxID=185978 RepID=UPI0004F69E7E|nr:hypothetical protein [Paenibacillus sp. FSL H7-0357]AIQ16791.1 hypothetical protein H70357_09040 [Paenibacillus sp. FSL H7-0357]
MKQMKIGDWNLEVDVEKTKDFYQAYHQITERCDCIFCKNFVSAIELIPKPVLDFFRSLGIDPTKEGEVSEYCEIKDGMHLYGGFFHIVGELISGPDCWIETSEEVSHLATNNMIEINGFKFGFTNGVSSLPDGFPNPTLQLEFEGIIPWTLKESFK